MILNPAIDHIRMATIHLVDRCLSKDYSRGKLAMKGAFSITDQDLRFLKFSDHLGRNFQIHLVILRK